MDKKQIGVTPEMLAKLTEKRTLLENVRWKPDKGANGKRLFFPYLPIDFVKRQLFTVLGADNLEFILEKDQPELAVGRLSVVVTSGVIGAWELEHPRRNATQTAIMMFLMTFLYLPQENCSCRSPQTGS